MYPHIETQSDYQQYKKGTSEYDVAKQVLVSNNQWMGGRRK